MTTGFGTPLPPVRHMSSYSGNPPPPVRHHFRHHFPLQNKCLIFAGPEGQGKSLFLNMMAKIIGDSAIVLTRGNDAFGTFTQLLERRTLVIVDEAQFPNPESIALFNNYITAKEIAIEG